MIKRGLRSKLAEVGKIKIGGKGETRKKSGGNGTYQLPVRYEHFVVTTTAKGPDGNFIQDAEIMNKIGPKPMEIGIRFLFDDIDMNFFTSFAWYQGAKCMCRGDGEKAEMIAVKKGKPSVFKVIEGPKTFEVGDTMKIECNTDTCPMAQPDAKGATKCKPSGILTCMLEVSPQIGGFYKFRTHSWNTIGQMLGSLELIKRLTGGILAGLPMKLQFIKKATEEHGNVNTVNVIFDGIDQMQMRQLALTESQTRASHMISMERVQEDAKASGILKDTDDPADVEAEFYTEAPDDVPPPTIDERADSVLGEVEPVPEGEQSEPEKVVIGTPAQAAALGAEVAAETAENTPPPPVEGTTVLPAGAEPEETEPEAEGQLDIF